MMRSAQLLMWQQKVRELHYDKFKNTDLDEDQLRSQVNKVYNKLDELGITKEDVKGIIGKLVDFARSILN